MWTPDGRTTILQNSGPFRVMNTELLVYCSGILFINRTRKKCPYRMEALEGEFGFDYRRLTQDCPLEMLEDKCFQTHGSMFSPKVSLQRRPP